MSPPPEDGARKPDRKSSSSALLSAFLTLTSGRSQPNQSNTQSSLNPSAITPAQAAFSANKVSSDTALPTYGPDDGPLNSDEATPQHRPDSGHVPHNGQMIGGPTELNNLLPKLEYHRPLPERLEAARKVGEILEHYRVGNILTVWSSASDLVHQESTEASLVGFSLLVSCVKSPSLSAMERAVFWEAIRGFNGDQHLDLRFRALVELTSNGRNVESIETALPEFLARLLRTSYQLVSQARKRDKKSRQETASKDEEVLQGLFQLTVDVIKFNSRIIRDADIDLIVNRITSICNKTTNVADISNSINVVNALLTHTVVPHSAMRPCLVLLCDVYRQLGPLKKQTWAALKNIFGSHMGPAAVQALLDLLNSAATEKPKSNTVRGPLHVLCQLMRADGKDHLPDVPLSVLLPAIKNALNLKDHKLDFDVMVLLQAILDDEGLTTCLAAEVDWLDFVDTFLLSAQGLSLVSVSSNGDANNSHQTNEPNNIIIKPSNDFDRDAATQSFQKIISKLNDLFPSLDMAQQDVVVDLFLKLGRSINDDAAETLVAAAAKLQLTEPVNQKWFETCHAIVTNLLLDSSRASHVRLSVATAMTHTLSLVDAGSRIEKSKDFILLVLQQFAEEKDPKVLEALTIFAVTCLKAEHNRDISDVILFKIKIVIFQNWESPVEHSSSPQPSTQPPSPQSSGTAGQPSICRIVVRNVIRLFLKVMNENGELAESLFDLILEIAGSPNCETDARICAVKLLFRFRSDPDHRIYVLPMSESESMAAVLCRTAETAILVQEPEDFGLSKEAKNTSVGGSQAAPMKPKVANIKKTVPPLWLYPGPKALPQEPPKTPSIYLYSYPVENELPQERRKLLKIPQWLETVIALLQQPDLDWEIYSYTIVHLGAQLKNHNLFSKSVAQVQLLRSILCDQVRGQSFHEPPSYSSLKKADVAVCILHILTMLISYNACFAKSEEDEMVRAFILGIGSWDRTSKWCIHALSVCCHELPLSVSKSLDSIVQKMSQIITQPLIAVHILEFLCGLARFPELYKNFREDEYKMVFGVSFRYLQYVRDQKEREALQPPMQPPLRVSRIGARHSDSFRELKVSVDHDLRPKPKALADDLPQYVYALAFHAITFWYMALRLQDRPLYMPWIARNLTYTDNDGNEVIEDQGIVTMDMMERVAYSDRDETSYDLNFAKEVDGEVSRKTWVAGLSLLTVETAGRTGLSQITRRRPSGTRYSIYRPAVTSPPRHQVPLTNGLAVDAFYSSTYIGVLPQDVLQEFYAPLGLSALPSPSQMPIPLPDDEKVAMSLKSFDYNSTVDGHKIGVIYIDENQTYEAQIFANTHGTADYENFLTELGTLTRLKGATFNLQGLDRSDDMDGKYAYCWRDRATEIVFQITTMMPNDLERYSNGQNKKKHTGNCFVNIVWNNSGEPFDFDTFPSAFNYVYIVITPESGVDFVALRQSQVANGTHSNPAQDNTVPSSFFYKVESLSAPGFPSISPASEPKVVNGKSLAPFVRLLALNASFFSLVWANREGGEHFSPWRNRLREIKRLRDRYDANHNHTPRGISPQTVASPSLVLPSRPQRLSLMSFGTPDGD